MLDNKLVNAGQLTGHLNRGNAGQLTGHLNRGNTGQLTGQ